MCPLTQIPQTLCSSICNPNSEEIIKSTHNDYGIQNFGKIYNATEDALRSFWRYAFKTGSEVTPCGALSVGINTFFNSYPEALNKETLPAYTQCMLQNQARAINYVKFPSKMEIPPYLQSLPMLFNAALTYTFVKQMKSSVQVLIDPQRTYVTKIGHVALLAISSLQVYQTASSAVNSLSHMMFHYTEGK